jgi:cytochrome c oxidase subunit 1
MLVHNTAWIPGHFHLTVGTAVTLTFFGVTYWLLPHLTGKPLYSVALARAANWTWFVGMMVFALGMHWQGLLAVPRRAQISNMSAAIADAYANAAVPMAITALSGVILMFAVIFYFTVVFGTLFSGKRLKPDAVPEIPWASARRYKSVGLLRFLDSLAVWMGLAIFLVVIAYLPSLITMLMNLQPVPGYRLW